MSAMLAITEFVWAVPAQGGLLAVVAKPATMGLATLLHFRNLRSPQSLHFRPRLQMGQKLGLEVAEVNQVLRIEATWG